MKTLMKIFIVLTTVLCVSGVTSAMKFNFHFDNLVDPGELRSDVVGISDYAQSEINKRIFNWVIETTNEMNMHPFLDKQTPMPKIHIMSNIAFRDVIKQLLIPQYLGLIKQHSREYADKWLKYYLDIIAGTFIPPGDIYLRKSSSQCKLESKIAHEIYHYLHWVRWGNRESVYGPAYTEPLDEIFARQIEKQYYRTFCKGE